MSVKNTNGTSSRIITKTTTSTTKASTSSRGFFTTWWILIPAILFTYIYHIRYEMIHAHIENWIEGVTRLRHNYDHSVIFNATSYHEPTSLDEIVNLIKQAHMNQQHIKVVGGGHSWSNIAKPVEMMVSLDKYSSLISIDPITLTIHIQAGMRLYEIQEILNQHGMALPVLPSIAEQSIAGALATGTHGSGINYGALHSYVLSMQMINGLGQIMEINATSHSHLFPAVRVHLGALGIVTSVKLQCIKAFNLHEIVTKQVFDWKQPNVLKDIYEKNDHAKIWLFPALPHHGLIYQYNHTDKPHRDTIPRWKRTLEMLGYEIIQNLCVFFPSLTTPLMSIGYHIGMYHIDQIDRSDKLFNLPADLPAHAELEYAIPLSSSLPLLDAFSNWTNAHPYINHAVEIRWVKGDDIWMSNDYGQDMVHLTLCLYGRDKKNTNEYFSSFEHLLTSLNIIGRPHWAKLYTLSNKEIALRYPKYEAFMTIRKQMDPMGLFNNPYLDHVFGPFPYPWIISETT